MAFEEVLMPSIFICKKKYSGYMYTSENQSIPDEITNKKDLLIKGVDFIKG